MFKALSSYRDYQTLCKLRLFVGLSLSDGYRYDQMEAFQIIFNDPTHTMLTSNRRSCHVKRAAIVVKLTSFDKTLHCTINNQRAIK